MRASLVVVSGDYSLAAVRSYSLWCLLLWWNKGSRASEPSSCDAWAELHVVSSQTKDQTHVPCIGRQIINHWTTREVSGSLWIQRKTWAVQTKGDRHWLEIKGQQEVSQEHLFADSSLLQRHASGDSCVPLWPQLLLAGWEESASSKSLALTGLRGTISAPFPFRSRGGNALKLLHSLADTKSF